MVYDVLRASRKAGFNSFLAVFVTDVLFWVVSAFVTFIFLMARTYGEVRGYVFAGEFIGFLFFRLTFSKLIFPILKFIFEIIKKIHSYLNRLFDAFYSKCESIILKICEFAVKNFKRLLKSIKKLLKNKHKMLYNDENNYNAESLLNETKT